MWVLIMSQDCGQEVAREVEVITDKSPKETNGDPQPPEEAEEMKHNGHDGTQNGHNSSHNRSLKENGTAEDKPSPDEAGEGSEKDQNDSADSQETEKANDDESIEFQVDTESVEVEVGSLAAPESIESGSEFGAAEEIDSNSEVEDAPVSRRTRSSKTNSLPGKKNSNKQNSTQVTLRLFYFVKAVSTQTEESVVFVFIILFVIRKFYTCPKTKKGQKSRKHNGKHIAYSSSNENYVVLTFCIINLNHKS